MEQSAGVLKALDMSGWKIIQVPMGTILDICFGETHGEELKESLGPSVYAGIVENLYPELLTTQLEIIAEVTRMDIKFWAKLYERKGPILDLYKISSNCIRLYEQAKEMAKGKDIKLILPNADNPVGERKPADPVLVVDPSVNGSLNALVFDPALKTHHMVVTKPRDPYAYLESCDQDNLHVVLGLFVLNVRKASTFGIILADDLLDVWNRAKEIYIGPEGHSGARMVTAFIQTLQLEQAVKQEKAGNDNQEPDLFGRMKTFNRVINNLIVAKRLSKGKE